MRVRRSAPAWPILAALLVLLPGVSRAEDRPFIDEPEPPASSRIEEAAPWQEGKTTLPPWPANSDLVEFHVDGGPTPFRYFIDASHLAVGADGVVRYTLVVESGSGARNVSYEGMRCTARGSYKIYAYGAGSRFKPVEQDWQPIPVHSNDRYHLALHRVILCVPLKFEPRPKKDMIRAMQGHLPRRTNAGFLSD
jgi:hypothetical protein